MDTNALTRSTLADLLDAGTLFLRRQCSIGVLRVNFDRAATRLRLLAPDAAEVVRGYVDELDRISSEPAPRQFGMVGGLLERFERQVRRPAAPEPPRRATAPEPLPARREEAAPPPPPRFLALPTPGTGDGPPPPPEPEDDDPALDVPVRRAL